MTISISGSNSPFLKQLEMNGLTASKAALVQKDLSASQTAPTSASDSTISPATRAAFNAKISADVLAGRLSSSDAASVRKTMDNLGAGSASSANASQAVSTGAASSEAGATAGAAKTGGGGGGGGGSKTELSETVTISGSTMTTVTAYTDGTTSTTTTTATDADKAKYDKAATNDTARGAAAEYQATIGKGAVFEKLA